MSEPLNDTVTQSAERPDNATSAPVLYGQDDQAQVKLIADMLDAAGNTVGRNKSPTAAKAATAYGQLHSAFRNLFLLRGQAFIDAFGCFVAAVNKYPDGIFYMPLVNANLSDFSDPSERETFMVFINMTVRFARCADKGNFAQTNNADRIAGRVKDPELQSLLKAVFLAE